MNVGGCDMVCCLCYMLLLSVISFSGHINFTIMYFSHS